MAARLPTPGSDNGTWGDLLNAYLSVAQNDDGTLKPIGTSSIQDDAVTASKISATLDQIAAPTGNVSLGGYRLTDVGTPSSAQDASNKTYADTKISKSGDTMTGKFAPAVVALTESSTISVDADLGNIFTITLTGDRILGNPENATSGQSLIFRITQDTGGSRLITWDTDYRFGVDITEPVLTTTASKTDYVGFIYNADAGKWDCVALARGY